ncbi:LPXTG cell wall anchor domain-containing protein [Leuconostoc mesenteroides]|uniref:LPXTG cell wall anchor domain-containing protein n=1 Tax=Leuconostoc mesenteroides TaxID=1245 RepID=UPI001CBEA445|nr:LPXTG cell wall anchor domain-containing protein [Leuconostoc mesenteroides]MBZ1523363.1 LPXTG cell wall anchor domain-containing protein [Leuconostoc mesenteroides]
MQNSKKYKLYKSGKLWVVGVVAVAGVAVSSNVTHVSADTVSNADAQAVKITDATQNDKQVQLTASSTDTATDKATTDEATKSATVSSTAEKSTVPTTAGTSVTQDQAKDAVDKAQDTVKDDAKTASDAGVDVTTGKTADVTINDDNASSKTNEVLSDLNKQDQAVKDATAKQQANDQAYQTAINEQTDATKQGQADLDNATSDLDKQVDTTEKAGIKVNVEVAQSSPEYKDLSGLDGQDLLDAMAYNIDLYKQAIADGVASEKADTETLAKLTAEYQQKQADYAKASTNRSQALQQGPAQLQRINHDVTTQAETAKEAGIDVSVSVANTSPKYKNLNGLQGQALIEAMAYNIKAYNQAVSAGVQAGQSDIKTLQAMTKEYQEAVAHYNAEKARVDKANADKKADYDQKNISFKNGLNHTKFMNAKTSTDMASGQYETFMNAEVNQATGEFTISHDMNDGVHVIGNGYLSGKIDLEITSNGDGTETVTYKGIHLYSYRYDNHFANSAVNKNINFHVYDLNGNELFSVYHDGNTSFTKEINKDFALDKSFVLQPGEKSEETKFMNVDDNWIWNTHGFATIAIENTNQAPETPTYEQEPVQPATPKVSVKTHAVDNVPTPTAPNAPKATVTKFEVEELPKAEEPAPQKVAYNLYEVNTTPETPTSTPQPETPTPEQPVTETPTVVPAEPVKETPKALPKTGADHNNGVLALASASLLGGLGLLGMKRKKQN